MTRIRRLRVLAAAAVVAAAGVVGVQAPAAAASCAKGTGVTVVVDGQGKYGGVTTTCASGGERYAAKAFQDADVSLTYARRQPGFVCKVRGTPATAACEGASPEDAYWSLWWSRGDGTWTYASAGVGSQRVPRGGWVAFSWNAGGGRDQPRVAPRGVAGSSSGSPSTSGGGSSSSSPSRGTTGTPSPSSPAEKKAAQKQKAEKQRKKQLEKAKRKADEKAGRSPSARASTSDAQESDDAVRNASQEGAGPGSGAWIAIIAVLALGGTAGFTAWRRHRTP